MPSLCLFKSAWAETLTTLHFRISCNKANWIWTTSNENEDKSNKIWMILLSILELIRWKRNQPNFLAFSSNFSPIYPTQSKPLQGNRNKKHAQWIARHLHRIFAEAVAIQAFEAVVIPVREAVETRVFVSQVGDRV